MSDKSNKRYLDFAPVDGCDDCAYYTEALGTPSLCPECFDDKIDDINSSNVKG